METQHFETTISKKETFMGHVGIAGMMILKLSLKKEDVRTWAIFIWLGSRCTVNMAMELRVPYEAGHFST
jgi:hypothetical protein